MLPINKRKGRSCHFERELVSLGMEVQTPSSVTALGNGTDFFLIKQQAPNRLVGIARTETDSIRIGIFLIETHIKDYITGSCTRKPTHTQPTPHPMSTHIKDFIIGSCICKQQCGRVKGFKKGKCVI